MLLKNISLEFFRNYAFQKIDFDSGINILSGRNAQGKTNLLEAIHFLSTGRSFRTPRVFELIQQGKKYLEVSGIIEKEGSISRLKIHYSEKNKVAHINERRAERLHEVVGVMNVVAFAPDDIEIVKGFPAERRRYLDMQIGQLKRGYLLNLYRYNEILKQRNASLKAHADKMLEVWDEELVKQGITVLKERKSMFKRLVSLAESAYERIVGNDEKFCIRYRTTVDGESDSEMLKSFSVQIKAKAHQERKSGTSLIGPQRDDLVFTINGFDVRSYGSEGQRRSVAIALRLAQYELAKEIKDDKPIILIDDVTAELDPVRKKAFVPLLREKGQVFVATASDEKILGEWTGARIFAVENGKIF